MARIRCFLIEPTERVQQRLRRYGPPGRWDAEQQKQVYDAPCPLNSYHNAEVRIEDVPVRYSKHGYIENGVEGWAHDDPRWPIACACDYVFQPTDEWQLFCDQIYRRVDTGEEMTLRDALAGAMWRAAWMSGFVHSQDDGPPLVIKTPGGEWCIDHCESKCPQMGKPLDPSHHCWTRSGTVPDVTASPSILIGAPARYHGWLRSGWLEDA